MEALFIIGYLGLILWLMRCFVDLATHSEDKNSYKRPTPAEPKPMEPIKMSDGKGGMRWGGNTYTVKPKEN